VEIEAHGFAAHHELDTRGWPAHRGRVGAATGKIAEASEKL
jgi:hypothetical protein